MGVQVNGSTSEDREEEHIKCDYILTLDFFFITESGYHLKIVLFLCHMKYLTNDFLS